MQQRVIARLREDGRIGPHDGGGIQLHGAITYTGFPFAPEDGSQPVGGRKTLSLDAAEFPEFVDYWIRQARESGLARCIRYLEPLNLPRDKLARVEDLVAEANGDVEEATRDFRKSQVEPVSKEADAFYARRMAAIDARIEAALGSDDLCRFVAACKSDGTAVEARAVAAELDADGVPLMPEQTSALARLLADFRVGPAWTFGLPEEVRIHARMWEPINPSTGLRPDSQGLLDQASAILKPEQLDLFRATLERQGSCAGNGNRGAG